LAVGRPLPVYPDQQIFLAFVGILKRAKIRHGASSLEALPTPGNQLPSKLSKRTRARYNFD
jgi:hypothetical protein